MNFAEKLKTLRKEKGISQEALAEKINVSRQAITKWETGLGLPDIENLIAISSLFGESLDNLLSEEKSLISRHDFLYESRTEYDLDGLKKIDLKIGNAHSLAIERTKEEKLQVIASSNKISELASIVKVKIEENRSFMDVRVNRNGILSDTSAMENLFVLVRIPEKFVPDAEISGCFESLKIRDITFENFEFGGKVNKVSVTNACGHLELDTNSSLELEIRDAKGKIDLNQIKAVSKVSFLGLKKDRSGVENAGSVGDGPFESDGAPDSGSAACKICLINAGRFTRFVDQEGAVIRNTAGKRDHISGEENSLIFELNGWKSEAQICMKN